MKEADVLLEQLRGRQDAVRGNTPPSNRKGQALCLSGGGYRAAIFHLGALLRLHEAGVLHATRTFSAVSGGSIVLAWLASRHLTGAGATRSFRQWCDGADFKAEVVEPFRAVVRSDIRTGSVLATLPHNWRWPQHRIRMLQKRYARHFGPLTLADLPDEPAFVFCATDLTFGVNWEFGKKRVGDYLAGYLKDPGRIPLALAVAASSSFPPVFGPMRLRVRAEDFTRSGYRGADADKLRGRIDLTDGGVYDNLGTEPALRNHDTVLVSDAGAPFAFTTHRDFRQLMRYTQVIGNQAASLRKRLYFSLRRHEAFDGAYWGLAGSRKSSAPGYSHALVSEVLGRVRTDLDRFRDAEFEVLVNHGYFSCHNALQRWPGAAPAAQADASWPYPERQDEADVRAQLKSSHKRFFHLRWFGG